MNSASLHSGGGVCVCVQVLLGLHEYELYNRLDRHTGDYLILDSLA